MLWIIHVLCINIPDKQATLTTATLILESCQVVTPVSLASPIFALSAGMILPVSSCVIRVSAELPVPLNPHSMSKVP